MASNFVVLGHDLDTVFAPYSSGTKAAATGYFVGAQDLKDRYQPGSITPTTGFLVGGVDINTMFSALPGGPADGGGGDCVCDAMFIRADLRAIDAVAGDIFDCIDLPKTGLLIFQHPLDSVEHKIAICVRLITERGAILDCSARTPFDLLDGRQLYAPAMLGEQVVTDHGVETVVSVENIGTQRICHNHLDGLAYAAGADPTHRIYSHNPLIKK